MAKKRRKRAHGANTQLRPKRDKTVQVFFPVYARKVDRWNEVLGETPLYQIDAATKQIWMDQGAIVSIGGGTAVRLLLNLPPKPQVSMTMTGVADGVVAGKPFALAVLAAYTPADREPTVWRRYGEAAA